MLNYKRIIIEKLLDLKLFDHLFFKEIRLDIFFVDKNLFGGKFWKVVLEPLPSSFFQELETTGDDKHFKFFVF